MDAGLGRAQSRAHTRPVCAGTGRGAAILAESLIFSAVAFRYALVLIRHLWGPRKKCHAIYATAADAQIGRKTFGLGIDRHFHVHAILLGQAGNRRLGLGCVGKKV